MRDPRRPVCVPASNRVKIKTLNESVHRANQIILGYIVLKCRWEQTALAPINPLHEA
jgi:hypothetical protein